jgi:hypothetical protein
MKKAICAALLALAAIGLLPQAAFAADHRRPRVSFTTAEGQIYVTVANPAAEDQVRGMASDARSGIRKVVVKFTACQEQEGACTPSDAQGAVNEKIVLSGLELTCHNHHRSCAWHVGAPPAPGFYRVRATAIDRAGNRSRAHAIRITVI